MRFSPGRYVDDLTGPWISCGGLGARLLDLKNSESTNLDSLGLHQAFSHSLKHSLDHVGSEILLTPRLLTDHQGEFFLGGRAQANTSKFLDPFVSFVIRKALTETQNYALS